MTTVARFERFLREKNLKRSVKRDRIVAVFLASPRHLSAEELVARVRAKYPGIGSATVYRTLKLMRAGGLCSELCVIGGPSRYEPVESGGHHDHLVCVNCGALVEILDPEIERLQDRLFKKNGFKPRGHRMELYGVCPACAKAK